MVFYLIIFSQRAEIFMNKYLNDDKALSKDEIDEILTIIRDLTIDRKELVKKFKKAAEGIAIETDLHKLAYTICSNNLPTM